MKFLIVFEDGSVWQKEILEEEDRLCLNEGTMDIFYYDVKDEKFMRVEDINSEGIITLGGIVHV